MFVLIVLFIIVIIALVKLAGGTQKADVYVTVKSRQTLEKYDAISFFRENSEKLTEAENVIKEKAGSNDEGTYIIRVRSVFKENFLWKNKLLSNGLSFHFPLGIYTC